MKETQNYWPTLAALADQFVQGNPELVRLFKKNDLDIDVIRHLYMSGAYGLIMQIANEANGKSCPEVQNLIQRLIEEGNNLKRYLES